MQSLHGPRRKDWDAGGSTSQMFGGQSRLCPFSAPFAHVGHPGILARRDPPSGLVVPSVCVCVSGGAAYLAGDESELE